MTRAERVERRLAERELDALLVTDLVNVRYLTGFTGSSGLAILGPDLRRFVTDFRYVAQAAEEVVEFDPEQAPPEFLAALSDGWGPGPVRLGFEDEHVSVRRHERLRELLPDRVELVPAGGLVEAERAIKEPGEIARIRAATALADDVYEWLLELGIVGRTEREIALAIEIEMRRRGAEALSFPSIVASGERGALPHAQPADVPIQVGTLLTIDMGARLDGYCSDCTRTWATGSVASLPDELAAIYGIVERAQQLALDAVRPGRPGREIDAVARDVIAAEGYGEHFGHGLGHGVGMEVHEAPRLARTADAELAPGHIVTVEPGIYLPGHGGVRIEDLAVVTDDGREVLTRTTKVLQAVE
jgi:Xaa-Pro aminopeptidase